MEQRLRVSRGLSPVESEGVMGGPLAVVLGLVMGVALTGWSGSARAHGGEAGFTSPATQEEAHSQAKGGAVEGFRLFDFHDNLPLAHGHKGGMGLVMDLGCPAAVKYMQGRWKQPWGEDGVDGAITWTRVSGVQGVLRFPGHFEGGGAGGPGQISIRLRIPASGGQGQALTLFLNGEAVANWVGLPAGEWVVRTAAVPAGVLVDGENTLRLQFRRSYPLAGGGRSAAQVDWVVVGGAGTGGGLGAVRAGELFGGGAVKNRGDLVTEGHPSVEPAGAGDKGDKEGVGACGVQVPVDSGETMALMAGDRLTYYLAVPGNSVMEAGLAATSPLLRPLIQLEQESFPPIPLLDGQGSGQTEGSTATGAGGVMGRASLAGPGGGGQVVKVQFSCESRPWVRGTGQGAAAGGLVSRGNGVIREVPAYLPLVTERLLRYGGRGFGVCLFHSPAMGTVSRSAPVPGEAGQARLGSRAERVIVWIADTLSAGKMKVYNPESRVQTPHMDRAAAMGVLFKNTTVQGNHSQTSHATIMTGTYPDVHQLNHPSQVLPKHIPTSAEWLRKQGYLTGMFSSNGYVSIKWGLGGGLDKYKNYIREGLPSASRFLVRDLLQWTGEQEAERLAALALEDGGDGKGAGSVPLGMYLYLVTIDPHVPYRPEPADLALYDDQPYHGRVNGPGSAQLLGDVKSGKVVLNERDRFRLEALYDGAVTYNDRHLGMLMEHIDHGKDGFSWDNTVLIITSDHGEEWWEHGSVGHGHSLYQELIGVPLILVWPGGIPGGTVVEQDVELVDLHATIMDLMGVEVNRESQGESLRPLMLDGGRGRFMNRPAIAHHQNTSRSVKLGRWKYILFAGDRDYLYDLEGRVSEGDNVKAQHPFVHRHLRDTMAFYLAYGTSWQKSRCGQFNNLRGAACF